MDCAYGRFSLCAGFLSACYKDCEHSCCNKNWTKQVLIKIACKRLGEMMAYSVWWLLHKSEDPSSSLQNPHSKPGVVWGICNLSAEGREGYDGLLRQSVSIRVKEGHLVSKKIRWRNERWDEMKWDGSMVRSTGWFFPEDPSSIPSSHIRGGSQFVISGPGGSSILFWPSWTLRVHTCRQRPSNKNE